MRQLLSKKLGALALAFGLIASAPAFAIGLDPAFDGSAFGPAKAKGAVVWSHGRSINSEDSESPTPAYLSALRDDGWDVMRFWVYELRDDLEGSLARVKGWMARGRE